MIGQSCGNLRTQSPDTLVLGKRRQPEENGDICRVRVLVKHGLVLGVRYYYELEVRSLTDGCRIFMGSCSL